jgi:hypothetical protein
MNTTSKDINSPLPYATCMQSNELMADLRGMIWPSISVDDGICG